MPGMRAAMATGARLFLDPRTAVPPKSYISLTVSKVFQDVKPWLSNWKKSGPYAVRCVRC
jgi:hypothetical protein